MKVNQKKRQHKRMIAKVMAVASMSMATLISPSVAAKTIWSDNSISLLHGTSYKLVPEETLTTMTLEHASGHSWGGLFYFVDRHFGEDGENGKQFKETYGEISPRFYLKKFDGGVIKSINAMATYEHGSNSGGFSQDNLLVGFGADVNISGMKYTTVAIYQVFNSNPFNTESDQQLTITYGWTKNNITVDGYVDYSFNNEKSEDQLHINPQFKYNIGSLFDTTKKVDFGIEYSYWKNKFGRKDENQSAVSALLKVHF